MYQKCIKYISTITWCCINSNIFQQAEHFCNSIGILQQFSTPSKFPGFDRSGSQTPQQQQNQEDYAMLFATLISRCAKDIDTLIESLPSEESSTELQVQSLKRLEAENKEAAEHLEEVHRYSLSFCCLQILDQPLNFTLVVISLELNMIGKDMPESLRERLVKTSTHMTLQFC